MAYKDCFLVSLAPVLVAVHTVNNLYHSHEDERSSVLSVALYKENDIALADHGKIIYINQE